jgi:hypothetical protein
MFYPTKILIALTLLSALAHADLTADDQTAEAFVASGRGPASLNSATPMPSIPEEIADSESEGGFCFSCHAVPVRVRTATLTKIPLTAIHP